MVIVVWWIVGVIVVIVFYIFLFVFYNWEFVIFVLRDKGDIRIDLWKMLIVIDKVSIVL